MVKIEAEICDDREIHGKIAAKCIGYGVDSYALLPTCTRVIKPNFARNFVTAV